MAKTLIIFQSNDGKFPYSEWIEGLKDRKARAIIRARLNRVALGNFGDCKSVGEGVLELRINFGPGYRVYLGQHGQEIVLLLCGGDKSSQSQDIQKAHFYWSEFSYDT